MNRLAVCLILLSASWMVSARDMRMHGANGDGGGDCPDVASTAPAAAAPVAAKRAPAAGAHKAKAPTMFHAGGDDDALPHMPRWHSFLQGMFR